MKRQWKKVMSGVLVAGFVTAGLLNGAAVHAANLDAAVTETTVSGASIKEMLAFAIADEYMAQAEYQAYLADRNCHFGNFAVFRRNSAFSPNYDFFPA